MKLFVSNKLEVLAARLAEELKVPLRSPLETETIVVQSRGMEKWLSLELALRLGICANCRFPFPNNFIEEVFSALIPEYKPDLSYDEDVLAWKIMEILPHLQGEKDFAAVRNYLGAESDQLKLFQLSQRIARLYDQYLVFRPEMILTWEEGKINKPERWQARLWREITASQGKMHKARLQQLFAEKVQNTPPPEYLLPQRIAIFGISYLPVYHLRIFHQISRHIDVNLFYLNPSQEFWADIKSDREISWIMQQAPPSGEDIEQELFHLDKGNTLLASLGAAGRDFFRLVANLPAQSEDLFVEPEGKNILTAIQSDIYYLRDRGKDSLPPTMIAGDDRSIQIHSCHSPLREVEALHDTLLALFEENGRLLPKDVLIMTPSIEAYTPYIEAVFESRLPKISYSIADRGIFSGSVIFKEFFALLSIGASRLAVADVLSVLENPAVSDKFGINSFSLNLIRHWVEETNIKWGLDGAHRKEYNLPEFDQNTWSAGLDRIKLGYALAGQNKNLFDGILPYDEIEGEQAEIFGRFLDFFESLMRTKKILSSRRKPGEWTTVLKDIVDEYFAAGEDYQQDIFVLNKMLLRIQDEQKYFRSEENMELSVIKHYLETNIDKTLSSANFLTGGVTFCALLPMRSIPFAVIGLIGMNNDAYPRQDRKMGFDLMEAKRRIGDRSLRSDDRYLFLETILSARNNLIISYVGQDVRDNSAILPSVLVSELTDYIDQGFYREGGVSAAESLTRLHHLHAFHPDYYQGDNNLFSYSQENYVAAAINNKPNEEPRFCAEITGNLDLTDKIITISELNNFYRNPVKYYLEKRLLLKLPKDSTADDDSEPFAIGNLQAYQIKQELIAAGNESDAENIFQIKQAQGALPVGAAGDYYFQLEKKEADDFIRKYFSYLNNKKLAPLAVDIIIGGYHIVGKIEDVYAQHSISCRPARLKTNDYLRAWLNHLLLNYIKAENYPRTAIVIGKDAAFQFKEAENAGAILSDLVGFFVQSQNRPLKLFPRASFAYAEALGKGRTQEEAVQRAQDAWLGDNFGRKAEAEEMENIICFGKNIPFDEEFMSTAALIFNALFDHREKLEPKGE
jgi:exodeoxyribonuclease V gamma subunit